MQELFVLRGGGKKRGITTTAILLFTQCHIYPAGVIVRNYINLNGSTIFHQPNVFTGYYFFSFFFLLRVALLKCSHHFSQHDEVREKRKKKQTVNFPLVYREVQSGGMAPPPPPLLAVKPGANDQAASLGTLAANDGVVLSAATSELSPGICIRSF